MEEEETRFTSLLSLTKADKISLVKVQKWVNGIVDMKKYAKMCIYRYRHRQSLLSTPWNEAYGVLGGNFYRGGIMWVKYQYGIR